MATIQKNWNNFSAVSGRCIHTIHIHIHSARFGIPCAVEVNRLLGFCFVTLDISLKQQQWNGFHNAIHSQMEPESLRAQ